eukprot:scaffold13625_cov112-Isochrysis_galbana.AAC.2
MQAPDSRGRRRAHRHLRGRLPVPHPHRRRRVPLSYLRILRDRDTCDRGGRAPRRPAPAPLPTVAWTRFHMQLLKECLFAALASRTKQERAALAKCHRANASIYLPQPHNLCAVALGSRYANDKRQDRARARNRSCVELSLPLFERTRFEPRAKLESRGDLSQRRVDAWSGAIVSYNTTDPPRDARIFLIPTKEEKS